MELFKGLPPEPVVLSPPFTVTSVLLRRSSGCKCLSKVVVAREVKPNFGFEVAVVMPGELSRPLTIL